VDDILQDFRASEPDPAESGPGLVYVCTECSWRDRGGMLAAAHHRATEHRVRGRDWPASWPDAEFNRGGSHGN
jgi:hypothetical protein